MPSFFNVLVGSVVVFFFEPSEAQQRDVSDLGGRKVAGTIQVATSPPSSQILTDGVLNGTPFGVSSGRYGFTAGAAAAFAGGAASFALSCLFLGRTGSLRRL